MYSQNGFLSRFRKTVEFPAGFFALPDNSTNTFFLEAGDYLRPHFHDAERTGTDNKNIRPVIKNRLQVFQGQIVSFSPPPVFSDPVRKQNEVLIVNFTVYRYRAEGIRIDIHAFIISENDIFCPDILTAGLGDFSVHIRYGFFGIFGPVAVGICRDYGFVSQFQSPEAGTPDAKLR